LPQETILFPDKSVLYQQETRKPVAMGWWRMAVAAALIGLVVLVWNLIPAGKQVDPLAKTSHQPTAPTKVIDLKTNDNTIPEPIANNTKITTQL